MVHQQEGSGPSAVFASRKKTARLTPGSPGHVAQ